VIVGQTFSQGCQDPRQRLAQPGDSEPHRYANWFLLEPSFQGCWFDTWQQKRDHPVPFTLAALLDLQGLANLPAHPGGIDRTWTEDHENLVRLFDRLSNFRSQCVPATQVAGIHPD
jgi:hypothetical protein